MKKRFESNYVSYLKMVPIAVVVGLVIIGVGQCKAQPQTLAILKSYKASNGITYKAGDTIRIGYGSGANGTFLFYEMGGWAGAMNQSAYNPTANSMTKQSANTICVLKKIKRVQYGKSEKILFMVGAGNITPYRIWIEEAIASCEITDCINKNEAEKEKAIKQLKQYKDLLDLGVITQEKYDSLKRVLTPIVMKN